jgi:outer membrane protein OmpA-like peptidoglycan-associated protein
MTHRSSCPGQARAQVRCAAWLVASAGFTPILWAQDAAPPLVRPTVDALVQALGGGATTRAFRRTQLPEVGSALCAGQSVGLPARPAPAGGTSPGGVATPSAPAAISRNLEVVPYAGDTTPGVNLDVRFATASDGLTKADQTLLDTLATALKTQELAQKRYAVAGHTDSTGDDRLNQELSCARALAVRRYLAGKGVALARLSAYGFGSSRPLDAEQPAAAANRRVEIRKAPE